VFPATATPDVAIERMDVPNNNPKIVIVDDSKAVLAQASATLAEAGYDVVTVDSPFAAASVMLKEKPDLVLMDVHMPALPGDKIVSMMRNRDHLQHLRVALFSSDEPHQLTRLARECGAAGVVHKGAALENLVAQVRALLIHPADALN
jgi:twitching motility two-component system response regulator PilG